MHFSRREVLKGMGAAGLTPLLLNGCASSESGSPPLPELPDYEWSGPLGPENLFEHGVASGDPLTDGVIIWTRVTLEEPGPVEVWWEMALDKDFLRRTAQGTVMTDAASDFTAKVDVRGLVWGRNYYYHFAVQRPRAHAARAKGQSWGQTPVRRLFLCRLRARILPRLPPHGGAGRPRRDHSRR